MEKVMKRRVRDYYEQRANVKRASAMSALSASRKLNLKDSFNIRRHRLGQSFRDTASIQQIRKRLHKKPKWMRVLSAAYHKYGGKHVMLMVVLVAYAFLGATIFYLLEEQQAEDEEKHWRENIERNRTQLIRRLMPSIFNNSELLVFLDWNQTRKVTKLMNDSIRSYENNIGLKYTTQKIEWDFWNAMLYAGTICTTIGYGHLYTTTKPGRIATMIYAIFGIPLVLSILDDLGKLLTVILKYPWLLIKMCSRRLFRYCTKQSVEEIRRLDALDKEGLNVFDLPIPVAIAVVVAWIFVCSATFCIWETEWDYVTAFYFFFISLSTIGLGDITPQRPKMMLMMFFYIIIGLSLVSMCVNLIQMKLERTYEKGKDHAILVDQQLGLISDNASLVSDARRSISRRQSLARKRVTLGIFQSDSHYSLNRSADGPEEPPPGSPVEVAHKLVQTVLSFTSPSHVIHPDIVTQRGARMVSTSYSIDDVMRLVNVEEQDLVLLSEMSDNLDADYRAMKEVHGHIDTLPPIDENFSDCSSLVGSIRRVPPAHPLPQAPMASAGAASVSFKPSISYITYSPKRRQTHFLKRNLSEETDSLLSHCHDDSMITSAPDDR